MTGRYVFRSALIAALLPVTGCATWSDKASADALAACERISDAEQRQQCRTDVVAVAEAEHRAKMDQLGERILEAEERERLDKVFGGPGAAGRK